MASEFRPIDISTIPELARLAKEVRETREPRVLRLGDEDVALLSPVKPAKQRRPRGKRTTRDDSLWNIVGIADVEGPTDVSTSKYKYLADAYAPKDQ